MSKLDVKLLRDLRRMWAQALAIALVMAAGVATLILATGAYRSLDETRRAYYERYEFADVFADVTRAPRELVQRIEDIPGVKKVEARIVKIAINEIDGLAEPATGIAISLPDHREPRLNRLYLRSGRRPEPGHINEVTVNDAFAKANKLKLGSTFKAILNGRKRAFKVVGIALSPEYVYALGPGDLMPDDRRFGVMWMSETALEAVFDLDGAFNNVAVKLRAGASEEDVRARLDALLARYGGVGAYGRKDQTSHAFLDAELKQLSAMARIIPPIFLLVSAFMINMTLSRLIALEREQIGLLKALGYGRTSIAFHYIKLVLAIGAVGIAIGILAGNWLGRGLTRLYADFYHFPFLVFLREFDIYLVAVGVSGFAAILGALKAVFAVVKLPPAEAMRPPAPPRYRKVFQGELPLLRHMSQLTVMALRHISRWPVRAALTALGIALAVALLMTAFFTTDSVEEMIDISFFQIERQDATVNFAEAAPLRNLTAVSRLPGVLRVESYRSVPIRIRKGHRSRRLAIVGKPRDADLSRVLDLDLAPVILPKSGLVVSERVAMLLHIKKGDIVQVDILEGRRGTKDIEVAQIVKTYMGLSVFMDLDALNSFMDEGDRITGVHIAFDQKDSIALYNAVKNTPELASIALNRISLKRFRETIAQNINIMTSVYVALSLIIAVGVVYNSARIQLSERARELASLRVLGFTRTEVSRVLITELALLTLAAIPLGWGIGYLFAWATISGFANDLYRVPFVILTSTYARAGLIVLLASLASMLIVRRRVDQLDLISVLKTRE